MRAVVRDRIAAEVLRGDHLAQTRANGTIAVSATAAAASPASTASTAADTATATFAMDGGDGVHLGLRTVLIVRCQCACNPSLSHASAALVALSHAAGGNVDPAAHAPDDDGANDGADVGTDGPGSAEGSVHNSGEEKARTPSSDSGFAEAAPPSATVPASRSTTSPASLLSIAPAAPQVASEGLGGSHGAAAAVLTGLFLEGPGAPAADRVPHA